MRKSKGFHTPRRNESIYTGEGVKNRKPGTAHLRGVADLERIC